MFVASKLLAFAIDPPVWVLLFLVSGLLLLKARPRLGRGLCWAALVALLLGGWTFVPGTILRELESRYPQLPRNADMQRYAGVIVLGGAIANSDLWTVHDQVALNDQAERMTAAVTLSQKYPKLKLVFTGGVANIAGEGLSEAQRAARFFDEMGVPAQRVAYESESRNTFENAELTAQLPGIDKTQPWLLLTSAFHMPRSMGVFQKVGWNVTPYPVDYRIGADPSWYDFSLYYGPHTWELALHEVVGYYAYKMAHWI